jgi:hypothetical protein
MQGNVNLVNAALVKKVGKFVLLSSLLTNGAAVGQRFNPGVWASSAPAETLPSPVLHPLKRSHIGASPLGMSRQ